MTRRVWVLPPSLPSDPMGQGEKTPRDGGATMAHGTPRRRLPRLRTKAKKEEGPAEDPSSPASASPS